MTTIFWKQWSKNQSAKDRTEHCHRHVVYPLYALLILMLSVSLLTTSTQAQTNVDSNEFSIMQISDTQHLSSMHPECWPQLTNWVVTNAAAYNVKMVVFTGDMVDDPKNPEQWNTANASLSQLLKADVPYMWDAGNHDQNGSGIFVGSANGNWLGSQYLAFNATSMRSKPYWVSDINDGKNTAVQFTCGKNYSVLIINLEFHANKTAIDWMTKLIESYPNHHIIVATHSYFNGIQGYGFPFTPNSPEWENRLRDILDKYPNVFLTLSGHYIHTAYPPGDEETSNHTRINTREETFFNRQMAHGNGETGADSVRIFTFNVTDPNDAVIRASTYDIYADTWKNDTWNLFTFREHAQGLPYKPPTPAPKSTGDTMTGAVQSRWKFQCPTPRPTVPPRLPHPTQSPPAQPSIEPSPTATPTSTANTEIPNAQSITATDITYLPVAAIAVVAAFALLSRVIRHKHLK